MHAVKRWKYYCDYCKKSSGRKDIITKHEKHCTMNPDRVCGLCSYIGIEQVPMNILINILASYEVSIEDRMHNLRNITNECPACILAAIRQSRICIYDEDDNPTPDHIDFNFQQELKYFWEFYNDNDDEGRYP